MNPQQQPSKQLLDIVWQSLQNKDLKQAIRCCNRLNREYPGFASGWYAASRIAQTINQAETALSTINRALDLDPHKVDWQLQRASCLIMVGDITTCRELLKGLTGATDRTAVRNSATLTQLAFLCTRVEMHNQAESLYRELILMEPGNGSHWYNLATIQRFKGQVAAAESSLDKAISLNREDYEAYGLRSDLRRQTPASNHVAALEKVLTGGIKVPAGEVRVCYALAKELEDIGDTKRSFAALDRAASLRRKHINYNVEHDLQTMAALRASFTSDLFEKPSKGHASKEPVFIIGLPRTGSTLVERILGSHSEVFGAGELSNFAVNMMRQIREQSTARDLPRLELVNKATGLDPARLGKAYSDSTRPVTGHTTYFTDKMPLNFLYAGLIHLALPNAKIIHLIRHPMDTCYAIYKRLFQDAYPWSYDLEEIAAYYNEYRKLMTHWKTVMPGIIYELSYEDLVTDLEAQARGLLDFCQLQWEPQCATFYDNTAPSTTASATQVRKPVYRSSVGRWKAYEQQLSPLRKRLEASGISID